MNLYNKRDKNKIFFFFPGTKYNVMVLAVCFFIDSISNSHV